MNLPFDSKDFTAKEWLELNAKLQTKKLSVMQKLIDHGHIQKDGKNNAQHYSYISEAGYKKHFQKLLTASGLAFSSSIEDVQNIQMSTTSVGKNGQLITTEKPCVRVKIRFRITDAETGFSEDGYGFGDGADPGMGDKAIYKAETGALKYFFANNFLVVGGDEPEKDEQPKPQNHGNQPRPQQSNNQQAPQQATPFVAPTPDMIDKLYELYSMTEIMQVCNANGVNKPEQIHFDRIRDAIDKRLKGDKK